MKQLKGVQKFIRPYWNYLILSILLSPKFLIKNVEPYKFNKLSRIFSKNLVNINILISSTEYRISQMDSLGRGGGNYHSLDYIYYQELLKQSILEKQNLIEYTNYLENVKNIDIFQGGGSYIMKLHVKGGIYTSWTFSDDNM